MSRADLVKYVEMVITEDERTDKLTDLDDAVAELECLADIDFEIMPNGIKPEEFLEVWNDCIERTASK